MIKKIISSILAVALVFSIGFTFAGCSSKVKNFDISAISSNGGLAVVSGGYMYYIAGGTDKFEDVTEARLLSSSIYKRAVDENGNPIEGSEPQLVYKGIAGFKYGGLYAFGEYLYFTTPSGKLSSTAGKMTDRTSFCRVRMDGKKYEELYTTETAEALTYAYYTPTNEELYLVVLEGSDLYSVNMRKKKTIEIAEDVTSVAFSSEFGRGNGADQYFFYTKNPDEGYLTQTGNIVYRATANGELNEKIASGETFTLYEVKYGYLYFADGKKIYRTTTQAGLDKSQVISHEMYTDPFFTSNGGLVGYATDESKKSQWAYVNLYTGTTDYGKVLSQKTKCVAYFQVGNDLYGINDSKNLIKLGLNTGSTQADKDVIISDKIVTLSIGDNLTAEIIGNNLYYYVETKTTDESGTELVSWDIQSIKI